MAAAMAQNPKLEGAAFQAEGQSIANQADADWQVTLRGAFGDGMIQALLHYRDVGPGREVTKELSSALFYTDTPLTATQSDQLVEIIAANSRNAQGKVDLAAMNTEAILAQAGALLPEPQLAALRRAQIQVQEKWAQAGAK